jgi:hypothetical protein
MYPVVPDEVLSSCIEMACYFVTLVGAVFGWFVCGRVA